jgi:hypothetical protein
MKTHAGIIALGILVAIQTQAAPVTLENERVRVAFDVAQKGAIVALIDLKTGTGFVATNTAALYELSFAEGGRTLTTADAEGTTVRREGDEVVVNAPRHAGLDVSATCRFRLVAGSPLVHGRIAVSNGLDRALRSVRFPIIDQPRVLGPDESRDCLLLPYCDGLLVHSPMSSGWLPSVTYPGSASMQAFARYNDRAGLFVAAFDNSGQTKSFAFEKRNTALRTAITHTLSLLRHGAWQCGYDVVFGTFQGDWQAAAELYKAWAVKQPWCEKTLAQRVAEGDVPRWIAEPSLYYTWSLRGDLESKKFGNRLPQAVAQADAWCGLLGVPTTMMLMSWEKHGPWITPDYFPPFGGEKAFSDTTAALHAKGHHTFVYLSGLNWTLLKDSACDAGHFDDTAAFAARGTAGAICDTNGLPQHFKSHPDMGEYAQLCPVTPQAREVLLGSALKCQAQGIDCVQADQILGGGMPPCYSVAHGHPLGGGTWSAKAVYALFGEIRREGKKRQTNFAWSVEEPGEFFIPVLDTYHARDYAQGRWPRDVANGEGVPFFTTVYHAYITGYGGDSCGVSSRPDGTALYQQGMNLVCGKAPAVAVWTRAYDPASTDAAQLRLLREHVRLWKTAQPYLVFGDRIAAPPLAVPTITNRFWSAANKPPRELAVPSVLHSAWRSPENKTATVFVCIARAPVTFEAGGKTLTLQPGEAILQKSGE